MRTGLPGMRRHLVLRRAGLLLQALVIVLGAACGFGVAYANYWAAPTTACNDTAPDIGVAGQCLAPPAAPWALAVAAVVGGLLVMAVIQLCMRFGAHARSMSVRRGASTRAS